MAEYQLEVRPAASKALRKLDAAARTAIVAAMTALEDNPRPVGFCHLKGHRPFLRVRTGDYRIVYAVDDVARTVEVAAVGHRSEVYEQLRRIRR